jgi:hypothetical protein
MVGRLQHHTSSNVDSSVEDSVDKVRAFIAAAWTHPFKDF